MLITQKALSNCCRLNREQDNSGWGRNVSDFEFLHEASLGILFSALPCEINRGKNERFLFLKQRNRCVQPSYFFSFYLCHPILGDNSFFSVERNRLF